MTLKKSYKSGDRVELSLDDKINETYSNKESSKNVNQNDDQNNGLSKKFYWQAGLGTIAATTLLFYALNGGFNKTPDRDNTQYDHPNKIGITKIVDDSPKFNDLPENIQGQLFDLEKKFYDAAWEVYNPNNARPQNEQKINEILRKRDSILNKYNSETGKNIKAEWRPYLSTVDDEGVGASIQFKYE